MTRVVRISRCLLSALFRRPTLSPAHHLRAQISHLHCPRHRRRRTAIQGSNGGSGSTAAGGRRACAFAPTWRTPRRLLWFGGGGEDSHVRTVGLSVLNWGLCANPTSLAERHAAAGGVRRPWGTAADPILRYRMGPHRGPSAAENVACWGLSCVTPLARRVKVAPVCDQPQPRQAPPGRWGCEAAG